MRPEHIARVLSPVPWLLVVVIFATMLSGRTDTPGFPDLGIRFVLFAIAAAYFALWSAAARGRSPERRPGPVPVALILFLTLYLFSAVWADASARIGLVSANVALVILVLAMLVQLSRYDAERVRMAFLHCMYWSALLFALASAVTDSTSGIGRAVAFGGGPNVFVRIMVWGAIASIALCVIRGRRLYLLALPVVLLFAALSASRGGLTAALLTGCVMTVVLIRRTRPAYGIVIFVVVPVLTWIVWSHDRVQYLLSRRFDWNTIVGSGYGSRANLWSAAVELFNDAPVFGHGMDSFYALAYQSTLLPYPHNLILEIATDLGLVGLFALAATLSVVFGKFISGRGQLSVSQVAMFAAGVFTLFASMFSGDFFDTRFIWVFFALALPLNVVQSRGSTGARSRGPSSQRPVAGGLQ